VAAASLAKLKALNLLLRPIASSLREVSLRDPALAKQFRRFYAASRLRRYLLLDAIEEGESEPWLPAAAAPEQGLSAIEKQLRQYADELRKSANADERKKLGIGACRTGRSGHTDGCHARELRKRLTGSRPCGLLHYASRRPLQTPLPSWATTLPIV
jgi:hypothetical protein